jgi:hypothetical protein
MNFVWLKPNPRWIYLLLAHTLPVMVALFLVEVMVGGSLIPLILVVLLPIPANGPIVVVVEVVAPPTMALVLPAKSVVSLATWP